MRKKELFQLIGQSLMMLVAVICGGGVMAAVPSTLTNPVGQGNEPEAEVTNPISDALTADQVGTGDTTGNAVFPEQSVTSTNATKNGSEVYEPQYDKLITQVRIARTPLDQISRRARNTKVRSMEFKYASMDYLPVETQVKTGSSDYAHAAPAAASVAANGTEFILTVDNAAIFNRRDLILVPSATGGDGNELVLWVKNRGGNTQIEVMPVNPISIKNTSTNVVYTGHTPDIAQGAKLIRMAKACAELDSQAPGYAIFPTTNEQYCQKFMAQVEQSTIDALTAKRFDINMSDQEEATLADMRLGMEEVFMFGTKARITDPETQRYVWMTNGIWNQVSASKVYNTTASDTNELTIAMLIDWTKEMFTGPAAGKSNKRIVLCGSELLAALQKLFVSSQYITNTFKKWDLEFTEFTTTFGSFEFILDEVFDLRGMAKNGLIIDADYLNRYTFEPFGRNTLDLDAQGTRDSKATVLREISAVVLKSPKNHAKIVYTV